MLNISTNLITKLFSRKNWLIFTFLIITAFAISIRMGIWQYERHISRVAFNDSVTYALSKQSETLNFEKTDYQEWQKITIQGTFEEGTQALVRRRYFEGQLGFWVVAKFATDKGETVLVNRGFTPATMAANLSPEVSQPSFGQQTIEGYLQKIEPDKSKPTDLPEGQVSAINFEQFSLSERDFEFYLHQINTDEDLQAINPPQLSYGPHLAYSLQWFAFAFMIVVGWFILTKKELLELNKSN